MRSSFHLRGLLLILAVAVGVAIAQGVYAQPPAPNRAGVVIRRGDGSVQTACVSFDEPTINGLQLLERSGLDLNVETSGGGATVCSIAGEGCHFPQEACFCQCKGGGPCRYWAYWRLNGGAWQFSNLGATSSKVQPGSVDGWAWGNGNVAEGARPPDTSFESVCPLPQPIPATAMQQSLPEIETMTQDVTPSAPPNITPTGLAATTMPQPVTASASPPATVIGEQVTVTAIPQAPPRSTGTSVGQYVLFGGAVAGLLAAIGLVARRQR